MDVDLDIDMDVDMDVSVAGSSHKSSTGRAPIPSEAIAQKQQPLTLFPFIHLSLPRNLVRCRRTPQHIEPPRPTLTMGPGVGGINHFPAAQRKYDPAC